ncbi:hypothetical protein [Jeotgalibacillus soli]|uniref:hypothetical protein n=1 Tax=Jeotgalibacillus soli TaxID=889306 RepID=UPI0006987C28|nr:hypothetical protein [Jeotgalibacillus soli]
MIISLLIIAIGLIPIVLAINVLRIYRGSELGVTLLLFMLLISLWQIDIGVLYLKDMISIDLILQLFQFFRRGPTFIVPVTFYIAYLIIHRHSPNFKNAAYYRILLSLFNRKFLWLFGIGSVVIYFINWTKLGIVRIKGSQGLLLRY